MSWVVGVDVGGTFTDFHAFETEGGRTAVHKVPSTPDDPSRAILMGLGELESRHGVPLDQVVRLAHGTTVATNALIERTGGRVAMITTAGFRDLVEIGRQIRPRIYDLKADAPPPLVPRALRFEVTERIGSKGEVLTALTDDEIIRVVEAVRASGAECCAVCLLFSFLTPTHEQRIGRALKARMPFLHVTLSSEVQPEFREYERFSTAILNAFLQPKVGRYMSRLEDALAHRVGRASIGISQSAGGLMDIQRASRFPIRTALSGPAAGVIGAVAVGRRAGIADLITLDIGGTSTDVCLIENGAAAMSYGRDVAEFPVRLPSIDIHTVGAGGGSIAHVGPDGLMKVGPRSAGAVPGPACYGRGGTLPAVSDANVVLGRLPSSLVGGGMTLDRDKAVEAIAPLAKHFGLSIEHAALGIVRITASNIVRAIRAVSVERGHDPRRFALMPFGGAGGLHAVDVARDLGMRRILVPPSPGILCAEGVAVSDVSESFVATCRCDLDGDLAPALKACTSLVAAARTWNEASHASTPAVVSLSLDVRYIGQNYELAVALPGTAVAIDPAAVRRDFLAAHATKYGHADPKAPIEIVNVRVEARIPAHQPTVTASAATQRAAAETTAPVWFEASGPTATRFVDRASLAPGTRLAGPVVITQFDSTTVVPPGCTVEIDASGSILIEVA